MAEDNEHASVDSLTNISASSVLAISRGYTITLSSSGGDVQDQPLPHLKHEAKPEELLPPEGYVPDVPLSRTESRFPSLDEVADDPGLSQLLGAAGAHVDIQNALQTQLPEEKCAALKALVIKCGEDNEWAAALAGDAPTLGSLVQWSRRKLQRAYNFLRKVSSCSASDIHGDDSPADEIACCSVVLRLLTLLCSKAPKAVMHLVDAGLPDTLVYRIDELQKVIASIEEDLPSKSSWRSTEITALPNRIVMLLTNLSTGPVAPERIWNTTDVPENLSALLNLVPDNPAAAFTMLNNFTASVGDQPVFDTLGSPNGVKVLFEYYGAAMRKALPSDSSSPLHENWCRDMELEEWPLLFSGKMWRRRSALVLTSLLDLAIPPAGSVVAESEDTRQLEKRLRIAAFLYRLLEDILEFEHKQLIKGAEKNSDGQDHLLRVCQSSRSLIAQFLEVLAAYADYLGAEAGLAGQSSVRRVLDKATPPGEISALMDSCLAALIVIAGSEEGSEGEGGSDRLEMLRLALTILRDTRGKSNGARTMQLLQLCAALLKTRDAQNLLAAENGMEVLVFYSKSDLKEPFKAEAAILAIKSGTLRHADNQDTLRKIMTAKVGDMSPSAAAQMVELCG